MMNENCCKPVEPVGVKEPTMADMEKELACVLFETNTILCNIISGTLGEKPIDTMEGEPSCLISLMEKNLDNAKTILSNLSFLASKLM